MKNGQKFMDVFGVARCIYDEKDNTTTIHLNGDWWDREYEEEEELTPDETAIHLLEVEREYMRSHGTDEFVAAYDKALAALRYMQEAAERTQADRYILQKVLKNIRAEVLEEEKAEHVPEDVNMWHYIRALDRVLSIIDNHLANSEEKSDDSGSSDQDT